jgi:endonuclease YncB( thermonuclease family)
MSKELFASHDNKTPKFSLFGINTYARVASIHDGDTLTCIIPIFNQFFKFTLRLDGIDTCEMTSENPVNKQTAILARNRLIELVSDGTSTLLDQKLFDNRKSVCDFFDKNVCIVWLECGNFDKYGRLLVKAKLHQHDSIYFAQTLIDEHLAYKYDGGKKLTEQQQKDSLNHEST